MRRFNKKTLIVLGVVVLALCAMVAAGMLYFLNRGHRQRILIEGADAYMAQKDYSRAVLQYRRAVSLIHPTGEMYYKYGLCLEKLEQPQAAFQAFELAVAADPAHWQALKRVGGVYYLLAQSALAQADADPATVKPLKQLEQTARALIRLRPADREGYVWLARARLLAAKPDEALAAIEDGRAKAPHDNELIAEKVRLLTAARRWTEAQKSLQQALEEHPDSPELLLLSAELAQRDRRLDDAQKSLSRVLELNPKNIEAHRQLSLLRVRQGRYDDAERELKTVCDLTPEESDAWVMLARFYSGTGRADESLKTLEKGRAANPRNVGLAVELCRAQIGARKFDDAQDTLLVLNKLGVAPHVLAWLEGEIALGKGKVAEARSKFLEATRKSAGEFGEAHFDLGLCYRGEGNFGAAEEQFRIAAHSASVRPRASMALAEVYLLEGEPERALAQCDESLRSRPGATEGLEKDPVLLTLQGRAQMRLAKLDEAEKSFRAALDAAPQPSRKAEVLTWLTRLSLARRSQALREEKKAEAAEHLAAAQKCLAEAAKLDAQNASVALMEAQLANLSGDKEKAAELRKRAAAEPGAAALLIREGLGPDEKDVATAAEMLTVYPENVEVLGAAADYFGALAEAAAQKARLNRQKPEAVQSAGREYRDRAVACARKVFEFEKTQKSAAMRLFLLLRGGGRAEEAQQLASQLTNVPVTKALGLAFEGLLLQDAGKKEDAVQRLKQSIMADDRDWRAHFWLAGVCASMNGRLAEAEVELGKALDLDPVASGPTQLLLSVLESEGKFGRVQTEIEKSLGRFADVSLLVRSAQLFERTGEMERAAARWKQATEAAPKVVRWQIEYARVLERLGRMDEALAAANRAAEIGPPSVQTARARIAAFLARGDRARAEQLLLDTVKSLPDDPTVYILAAEVYQAVGASSEAESSLKQLAEKRKGDAAAQALLADFYVSRQRFDEGIRKYRDALAVQPEFTAAEYGIIRAQLMQAGQAEDAAAREAFLKEAEQRVAALQKRDPKSLRARMASAELLLARGEADRAEEFLKGVVQEFDKNPAVRIALARLYLQREKFEDAEREIEAALAMDDHLADGRTLLAQIHVAENRYKQALEDCQAVLRYEPTNLAALNLSAQIKQRTGRGAEALADLRKIVSLNPSDRAALMRLVQALTAQKADREALAAARQGYAKNPSSAAFLGEYVSALRYLKQFDEAAAACRAFIATTADNETGNLMLAQVLFDSGAAPQARESLQAAEQAARNPRLFLMRAANLCSLAGDHDRAIAYAARLAEQSPADVSALSLQLNALTKAGREKDAAQVAAAALQRNPDSAPFLRAAVSALMAARQPDEAAAACAEFMKRRPADAQVSAMYIELLARTGKRDAALAETKRLESVAGPKSAPDVTAGLARAYASLGELRDAERVATRLCEQAPENAQAWLTCASILEAQGAPGRQRAIPLYRKALSRPLVGHLARALLINNLAYALAVNSFPTQAEKDRALAEAEALADGILGDRETAPGFLLDTVGWVKYARNKFEESQQLLALATSRPDASAESWYHYAMACAATGRAEEAVKAAGKAVQMDPKSPQWQDNVKDAIARNQKKP